MGATTALALATYGVRVHVVSKWNWLSNTPRAHITNQRAAEVLRDLGVLDDALAKATPWQEMGDTLFTTSLAGTEIARLRTWGTGDNRFGDYLRASPCGLIDLPQPLLEPILVEHAAQRGAQVSFNTEYLRHVQDEEGVTVWLRDRVTGAESSRRAQFLVGADGAKSQIAEEIGLPITGEMARAGTVYTQFTADLSRYVAHRSSILHWIMNPAAGFGEIGMGLLRAVRPWDKWIAGWGFDLSQGDPDLDPARAIEKIRILVGDPDLEPVIESISPWYVNRAYATEYSVGRVFCGGDAVHRHPPSSGLGSNTSIQDAHNLAWKLAFVVLGHAGRELLETYTPERAPVGRQIVERANQSRADYAPLRAAFATVGEVDPVAAGLAKISAPTPAGAATRQELRRALELKDFEFNAQGVEMNQRYESTAILLDAEEGDEVWSRDPQLYVQSTTRPGAKLPHAWLVNHAGHRVSTLDVVGAGQYSLVTGLSGTAWAEAARELQLPYLRTVVIGEAGHTDPYFEWADVRQMEEGGALLVRPDGVVAWRQVRTPTDRVDARRQLEDALASLLSNRSLQEVAL